MKMHANYTCITCTSEATKKIYSEAFNTDIDKVQVLGMPRIDYLLGEYYGCFFYHNNRGY